VLETASLNVAALAAYCRRKGPFAEQIAAWREVCRTANANATQQARMLREQSKGDRTRIRQLEKDSLARRRRWLKPPRC